MYMQKPKIAITPGDTNGIGYEIILKTLNEPHLLELCTPVIYGSLKTLTTHRHTLQEIIVNITPVNSVSEIQDKKVCLVNCTNDETPVQFGIPTQESAKAAYDALGAACKDLKEGKVDLLVTAPINKQNMQQTDFHYPGHTEFLAAQFATDRAESLMMLVNRLMRIALVTNHLPISQVAQAITEERIIDKLRLLNESLQRDFQIRKPRIAVLALNPHAGDNGFLGTEEVEIIEPAIEKAAQAGINAFGPFAADGFFGALRYRSYDAVLAMYHDQGLAPFKALDMSGVNYTAGLPIVRTSPDHGTAYEIAGKNLANEDSFRQAIYTAVDIWQHRLFNDEISRNPLVITDKHRPKEYKPMKPFEPKNEE
ncbi:MAG: 4-hydroxythreonine-4-phosphate dehydrogenase PdxA [Paludibacteraceae bacterium]|nr:4-hydroxythreonine-4-phosphate dehydrogenase PdxA [Paludibacteraceae bacterium]